METFFLVGAAQTVLLAGLVFIKKNRMVADFFLAAAALLTGVQLFSYSMYSMGCS